MFFTDEAGGSGLLLLLCTCGPLLSFEAGDCISEGGTKTPGLCSDNLVEPFLSEAVEDNPL